VSILIGVYPSTFFKTQADAFDYARRASRGMPWIGEGNAPLKVVRAWVEGDEYAGRVLAEMAPRPEVVVMTMLEWLKMIEIEEQELLN
jgi:hypothetical protein